MGAGTRGTEIGNRIDGTKAGEDMGGKQLNGLREERGRWMIIRRRSGDVIEESSVWVSANTKPRRNKRKGTTTAQKQDENERDAVKRLARIINANYAHGDLFLTLKYDDEGFAKLARTAVANRKEGQSTEDAVLEAAEHDRDNFLRRLKRTLKKQGMDPSEIRIVASTSDMDGKTEEFVRPHHHLVIPRVTFEEAACLWHNGSVEYQILRDQKDYTPLAAYICKQVRRRPDAKKWTTTRNMKKTIVNERWAKPGEVLKPDRHARLTGHNQWEPGKPQYIRFVVGAPLPAGRGVRKKLEEALEAAGLEGCLGEIEQYGGPPDGNGDGK